MAQQLPSAENIALKPSVGTWLKTVLETSATPAVDAPLAGVAAQGTLATEPSATDSMESPVVVPTSTEKAPATEALAMLTAISTEEILAVFADVAETDLQVLVSRAGDKTASVQIEELLVAATAAEEDSAIAAVEDTRSAQNATEDVPACTAEVPIHVTTEIGDEMLANKTAEVTATELPANSTVESDNEEEASIGDSMVPILTMKPPKVQNEVVRQAWRPGQGRLRRHLRRATCFSRGR